jgi:hypothetical protein
MGAHSHVGLKPLPTVKRSRACASVEIARGGRSLWQRLEHRVWLEPTATDLEGRCSITSC